MSEAEEFRLLVETGRFYFDAFLKGAAFYFAIVGVELSVFFHTVAGSSDRRAIFYFGIIVNLWALGVCLFSAFAHRDLVFRTSELAEVVGAKNVYTRVSLGAALAITAGILAVNIFWLCLLGL